MKKELSLVMISLSWIVWLVAVFVFPISENPFSNDYSIHKVSSSNGRAQIQFTASPDVLEIPEFKVDWSLNAKLNPDWYVDLHRTSEVYLAPSFFKKSTPLFDVKDTFIHYFHTW